MFVVAITELAASVDAEAAALARDRGTTAYEERLQLASGLPAIVLRTTDRGAARDLAAKLRGRKHAVVAFDADDVAPNRAMVTLRRFELGPNAIATDGGAELPYADLLALIRATWRSREETRTDVKKRAFSLGRALATGGLVLSKTSSREERTVEEHRDQVLYLFRRSGQVPWILHERGTNYSGLGANVAPSSLHNFVATIGRLRELAPDAAYDERLMASRGNLSSSDGVDLLAHVLALSFGQGRA